MEDTRLHDKEAPGIGLVNDISLATGREVIHYQYFGLDRPPSLAELKEAIPALEGHPNFGFSGNWVQKLDSVKLT